VLIMLKLVSVADLDTSLCLFPEHFEGENYPFSGTSCLLYLLLTTIYLVIMFFFFLLFFFYFLFLPFQAALCSIIITVGVISSAFGTYSALAKIVENLSH